MSDNSKMPRVTVTLGRGGRVVKRAGGIPDDGVCNGVPIVGSKRSVRDRLGGIAENRSESYDKQKRGGSTNNSIDMCLGEDDLRFKLMQKHTGQEPRSREPPRNVDLRDKLSSRTSRPSADGLSMRPLEPTGSMRHFLVDPRIAGMARPPILETRDASILGQFPISRNPIELPAIVPPRSFSSWTLENLRQRSPEGLRHRSPGGLRRRSPEILRRRSPEVLRHRSPEIMRRRSPELLRRRSPEVLRRRSPDVLRRRSPGVLRRRSPEVLRRRSPGVLRRRSPEVFRRRSPGALRLRSPEDFRGRSPQGLRRRSPQGLRRMSPGGLRPRSPQGLRLISPERLRRRSPHGFRRTSPEVLRRRSPERIFHPSAARGISPQSREGFQRRPSSRPYDDRGPNAIAGVSPRRAVQSSPYLAQASLPAPRVMSPAPHSL
ncbi:hypothetical protein RND81_02G232000 [Saponaria officinalis]|uniref:Uncharacterized protein n=1 Tax=Saponaria officinalis TaxID=3572 RepID=A0AAW1MZR8_SAPOF